MPCTTILVGKKASYDGSTLMARNEDSGSGSFASKKFIVVNPEEQPRLYQSVISKVKIELPETPMRYTAMPNANASEGIWGEAGINEMNVAMSETETITSNPRVLGADPLVKEGIGEEDMLTIVLPYIQSAREGVQRLGALLEQYGTYEMNGIGFQDVNEIWWLETIGGHHWIAKRVPDDAYVVMPNQQGIDSFDFQDAYSSQENHMCSADMIDFIEKHHLDLTMSSQNLREVTDFDTRAAFGSHSDSDHSYNTPRAWYMLKYFNHDYECQPEDNDLPWCLQPEHKITIEDIKYVLSSYYQGTPYNPYLQYGDESQKGKYRPIGINRNNFVAITQLRPYLPKNIMAIEWIAVGSNAFNQCIPFYANITKTPDYLAKVTDEVTTENFYWANRIIGALSDAHYHECSTHIERYQLQVAAHCHSLLEHFEQAFLQNPPQDIHAYLEQCNQEVVDYAKQETNDLLSKVLYESSCLMKNSFSKSDG